MNPGVDPKMKEIVVISGKGGTGKTSVAASFAYLAERPVIADCDVDAADLHLVLGPNPIQHHLFRSGHRARIEPALCNSCGICKTYCRFDAVELNQRTAGPQDAGRGPDSAHLAPGILNIPHRPGECLAGQPQSIPGSYWIDPLSCEGCGVCVHFCPTHAIAFDECVCGEWMVSETRCGPMVHAKLGIAAENSGKLVSTVRREARRIATEEERPWIIVDGPPGIGCPVIAAITGSDMVVVVTEPTVSGEHDLNRVLSLAAHFRIPAAVCLNKWDLNQSMTERIEGAAQRAGARLLGRIRYDPAVTKAQLQEMAVVETDTPSAQDVRYIWKQLESEPGASV